MFQFKIYLFAFSFNSSKVLSNPLNALLDNELMKQFDKSKTLNDTFFKIFTLKLLKLQMSTLIFASKNASASTFLNGFPAKEVKFMTSKFIKERVERFSMLFSRRMSL